MAFTFKGGTHLNEHKNTRGCPIAVMPAPQFIYIPMSQHIGVQCVPVVAKGDRVLRGQLIGRVEKGLGCPVHSSVSGTVADIVERGSATGAKITDIVIDNDYLDELDPSVQPFSGSLLETTPEQIIEAVKNAGISGMGGATFPTYAKIQSALGKVDTMIVNCAECEPFITANHRLLLERTATVINGAKILLRALGLDEIVFAVEDNKLDAANILEKFAAQTDVVTVKIVKTKYPQGDERQLIYALTRRMIPAGKLPADVGCVVFNAETCASVYNYFLTGLPLVERIVTVSGDCVSTPKNLQVPIGTPYSDLFRHCGGFIEEPFEIINGGPMMGQAVWDYDTPVTKGTSAVLALSKDITARFNEDPVCIHCGRCVHGCPMHLMPNYLALFARADDFDECEKYNALSCVECGCCTYNCPAHVPIVQYIRIAKGKIQEKLRAAKLAAASSAKPADPPKPDKKEEPRPSAPTEENKKESEGTAK
ncbi:MAG: electron transport complex subunit RsxC [Clostridia bacterium]|nr:electron transport complex subunit RsxC [Clostridia bacterium]